MDEDPVPEYLAKHPFLDAASEEVNKRGWDIEEIDDENIERRAKRRVISAIRGDQIDDWADIDDQSNWKRKAKVEILSYPLARILVSLIDEFKVTSRYAKGEAERAYHILTTEDIPASTDDPFEYTKELMLYDDGPRTDATLTDFEEHFDITINSIDPSVLIQESSIASEWEAFTPQERVQVLEDAFNTGITNAKITTDAVANKTWSETVEYIQSHINGFNENKYIFSLPIPDYLKLIERTDRWHLSQQVLYEGNVVLGYDDLFEVLKIAIERDIKQDLPLPVGNKWDDRLEEHKLDILATIPEDMFHDEIEEVNESAFPPVIETILEKVRNNEHVFHEERFTLASFLINIGMSNDEIVDMLDINSDFGREQTEYQLNHIRESGEGGEEYTPPTYEKIRTWGIEWTPDELEKEVKHPLVYYRIRLNDIQEKENEEQE